MLKCVLCGREYETEEMMYTCPSCGIDGTLDVLYDYQQKKKELSRQYFADLNLRSLWRYSPILPVSDSSSIPSLEVGWTPLYESAGLASKYGVRKVYVKDDGRNPTGSLKDRASAVGVAKALDFGQNTVACASTGNAASSLSGFAACSGLKSYIFVPEKAPAAKVTQLLVYGANVILVRGDYEDAFNLATAAIEKWGWYNRNCAINPFLVEGKKTCALEIAEQLGWDVPDRVFVSVGDGCIISSIYKAFYDLLQLGLTDRMPMITGVQAEGASPIYTAVKEGTERVAFAPADTIADSISVGAPRNWAKALRAVRKSGGDMVTVSDREILEAIPELARETGVFGEPAGVTGFAGFKKMALSGELGADERIAFIVTGNGLKDIASAQKAVGSAMFSDPDIRDLESKLGNPD
jgi:threonine synthase